jgi:succinoglycan biosynthesis protein ExoO
MSEMTVSVIIAAYNAKAFIERAISSALKQSLPPLEVVVVDDCSNDGTREWLRSFSVQHPTVKIVELSQNGGPSAARNAGIEAAQGEWLAILDADDAFAPERLARLVPFAVENNCDFVADDLAYYDAVAETVVGRGIGEETALPLNRVTLKDFLAHNLADGNGMDWGLLKPVFRHTTLIERNIRYDTSIKHGEDFQIIVELLLSGAKLQILPEPLYLYTQRHGTQSKQPSGFSRTIVTYGKLKKAAIDLAHDPRIASDLELVRLLQLRARGLGRQDDAQYISIAFRNGSYLGLVKKIASDTGFLPLMCAQIGRAIRRRLHVHQ